jgi:hypothetical protein
MEIKAIQSTAVIAGRYKSNAKWKGPCMTDDVQGDGQS